MKTLMILVCKMHLVIKLHLTDSRVYREIDLVEMTYDQFFTHFVHPTFPPLVLTERDGSMRQKTGHPAAGISLLMVLKLN